MKTTLINTHAFYCEIIAAPDAAARRQVYLDRFIRPWQQMMQMFGAQYGGDPQDELAGARAWNWLLPEQLEAEPEALRALAAADAWSVAAGALQTAAAALAPYEDRLPIDHVEGWLVLADPARDDPVGRGYTGAVDWTVPRFVAQYATPNDYNLPRLPGLVAHEMHHLIRLRLFPWDMMRTSVADYIIHEGLAESFAAELFGADKVGYFVTEISAEDLATARRMIEAALDRTGFNVIRAYIFGDHFAGQFGMVTEKIGMPTFGGYATGYQVVQAYLQRTGRSAVEATFLPAAEIVGGSGYFD